MLCGCYFVYVINDGILVVDVLVGYVLISFLFFMVYEISFFLGGIYMSIWECFVKDENGDVIKNVKVWCIIEDVFEG